MRCISCGKEHDSKWLKCEDCYLDFVLEQKHLKGNK